MSMEFFTERTVKSRKPRRCDACQRPIEPNLPHVYMTMKYDGDFSTARNHAECRDAECGLAELHGLGGGEDWAWLHSLDTDDREWVEVNHPAAFSRLKGETGVFEHDLNEECDDD